MKRLPSSSEGSTIPRSSPISTATLPPGDKLPYSPSIQYPPSAYPAQLSHVSEPPVFHLNSQSSFTTQGTDSSDSARLDPRCLRGEHASFTKYGLLGILSAVFLFPLGLVCLLIDKEKKCSRCGELLEGRVSC